MKTPLLIVIVTAAAVVGIAVLAFWPASQTRVDSDRLLEASRDATEQWLEARGLLRVSTFISPDGDYAPITARIDQGQAQRIRHRAPEAPNPKALAVLQKGQASLSEALDGCEAAKPVDRAVALRTAGQLHALTALYYEREAGTHWLQPELDSDKADGRRDAVALVAEVERQADELAGLARQRDAYSAEADDDASQVEQALANARQDVQALSKQLAEQDAQVGQINETIKRLEAQIAEQATKAAEHRAEGRATPHAEGYATSLAKAQEYERAILSFRNQITAEQRKIDLTQTARDELALRASAAEQRVTALAETLDKLNKESADASKGAAGADEDIDALIGRMKETLGLLAGALDKIAQADAEAHAARQKAIAALVEAENLAGEDTPEAITAEASNRLALAELQARRLGAHSRISQMAELVNGHCNRCRPPVNPPGSLATMTSFLKDAAGVRQEAEAEFTQAASMFEEAANAATPDQRAVLQAQAAVAHHGLYRLTGSEASLKKAQRLRNTAKGGAQDPRIADIIDRLDFGAADAPSEH